MMSAVTPFRVLSLGAGVQSSTVAMMMEAGELPKPDCAIFADTKAEPRRVYEWLAWLKARLSFPVHVVTQAEGLTANVEAGCAGLTHCSNPPFFVVSGGLLKRNCTRDYKIAPILRQIQTLRAGRPVVQVFGISWDEYQRRREPARKYIVAHEYPLCDLQMTRQDCLRWMATHGYPLPPRSACVYCPYRCNLEWRRMRDTDPEAWAEACRVDAMVRGSLPGVRGQNGHTPRQCFVHRSRVPLAEVDLSTDLERGQQLLPGSDGWANCEGMCGI